MDEVEEHRRAEQAIGRIPGWAAGIVLALLTNVIGITWWAASTSERLSAISAQMTAIGSLVTTLAKRLDDLRETVPSSRDLDSLQRSLVDHENRLREVERPKAVR